MFVDLLTSIELVSIKFIVLVVVVDAPYNYKSIVFVKFEPFPAYAVAVTVPLTSSAVVGDTLLIESLLLLLSQKNVLVDAILVPLP